MGSDFKFYSLVDEERACGLGGGKESAFSSYNKFISDGFNGEYQCDGCQIVLLLLLLLFFVIVIIKCCLLWYYKLIFFFPVAVFTILRCFEAFLLLEELGVQS